MVVKARRARRHPPRRGGQSAIIGRRAAAVGALFVAVTAAAVARVASAGSPPRRIPPANASYVTMVDVVATKPHDPTAFTQGLCFDGSGRLLESDGIYSHSRVRVVEVDTGKSVLETKNDRNVFGEGLTTVGDVVLQLTWREKVMIEYDMDLVEQRRVPQPTPREGWGVAYDAEADVLYITDGTATLRAVRRAGEHYVKVRDDIVVHDDRLGLEIEGLNEVEMVRGELWANVYPMRHHKVSNCIARIDPVTGSVLAWVDAKSLIRRQSPRVKRHPLNFVLNGIAFNHDGTDDHLYLTGKQWDYMFDVDLTPKRDLGPNHVMTHCSIFHGPSVNTNAHSAKQRTNVQRGSHRPDSS